MLYAALSLLVSRPFDDLLMIIHLSCAGYLRRLGNVLATYPLGEQE